MASNYRRTGPEDQGVALVGGWPAKKEGKEKRAVTCNTTDTIRDVKEN
jgi:hypothetical protein